MISCDQFLESLSDLLDGELAPTPAESARLHALQCARCRELLASSRQMLGWAQAEGQAAMPTPAVHRLRRALQARMSPPRPAGPGWLAWRWRASFASVLVLMVLAFGVVRWRAGATTVSGWLIDQGCAVSYRTHPGDHTADCLRHCAAKGLPMGLINLQGQFEPFDAQGNRSARAIIQNLTQPNRLWVTAQVRRASHDVLQVEHLALATPPPGS